MPANSTPPVQQLKSVNNSRRTKNENARNQRKLRETVTYTPPFLPKGLQEFFLFSEISSIGSFPAKNEQFQYSHTKIKSSVRPIGKVAGNTARSLHSLGVESDKEQESRGAQQQLSVMGILKE